MKVQNVTIHTPGPWIHGRDDMQSYDSDGMPFTSIYSSKDGHDRIAEVRGDNEEMERANAKLIAAAPDLLEALEQVDDMMTCDRQTTNNPRFVQLYELVRKAIAKARGKA